MTITSTGISRAVAAALMLAAALPAAGQGSRVRSLVNEPGTWKPWTFGSLPQSDLKLLGFTPGEASALTSRLEQLGRVFRTSPVWNPPMGVDPSVTGSLFGPPTYLPRPKHLKYQPVTGSLMIGSFEHVEAISQVDGKEQRERNVGDETVHIMVHVNRIPRGPGVNMLSDEDGEFFGEMTSTTSIGGYPTYGGVLVIAKNGRPLWTPVSRERYLNAFIKKSRPDVANAERYLIEQQKLLDAFLAPAAAAARQARYQAAIDKMASRGATAVENERHYWARNEAGELALLKQGASRDPKVSPIAGVIAAMKTAEEQVATMSPAERGAQACLREDAAGPSGSGLVAMGTPGCMPLVTRNLDFFDTTLPRGVLQIITVSGYRLLEKTWKAGRPSGDKLGNDLWTTYEVFRQTDWSKVGDLIGK